MKIILDSGILGFASHPQLHKKYSDFFAWIQSNIAYKNDLVIPEVADYEVRRSLIKIGSRSISILDDLQSYEGFEYLPINTRAMRIAAESWATARKQGKQGTGNSRLDADMVLVGQTLEFSEAIKVEEDVVLATTNIKDLEDFCNAKKWEEIN